jgi:hypothetical protein
VDRETNEALVFDNSGDTVGRVLRRWGAKGGAVWRILQTFNAEAYIWLNKQEE